MYRSLICSELQCCLTVVNEIGFNHPDSTTRLDSRTTLALQSTSLVRVLTSCMYVYMYVCMYACLHVCMYVCMYVCLHVCMCACCHAVYVMHSLHAVYCMSALYVLYVMCVVYVMHITIQLQAAELSTPIRAAACHQAQKRTVQTEDEPRKCNEGRTHNSAWKV